MLRALHLVNCRQIGTHWGGNHHQEDCSVYDHAYRHIRHARFRSGGGFSAPRTADHRDYASHDVQVAEDSMLYKMVGTTVLRGCPSWHHQAVKSVDHTPLTVTGYTETNGIPMIEAVERTDRTFEWGYSFILKQRSSSIWKTPGTATITWIMIPLCPSSGGLRRKVIFRRRMPRSVSHRFPEIG